MPTDWAATHNNLAACSRASGGRESGTERLEEALGAYGTALGGLQPRGPTDWAPTQNNVSNVLQTLGERDCGTARLEQAVLAYRAALEDYTSY
jgi:hypothetical protein